MLVVLIVLVIEQKIVLSFIPIFHLNRISRRIPQINKTHPIIIDVFRYFSELKSLLMSWGIIKNNPRRLKNMMSFPLEDPIKNVCVMGLIIGLKRSVVKITPENNMNINPIMIVLLSFINNNLILIL